MKPLKEITKQNNSNSKKRKVLNNGEILITSESERDETLTTKDKKPRLNSHLDHSSSSSSKSISLSEDSSNDFEETLSARLKRNRKKEIIVISASEDELDTCDESIESMKRPQTELKESSLSQKSKSIFSYESRKYTKSYDSTEESQVTITKKTKKETIKKIVKGKKSKENTQTQESSSSEDSSEESEELIQPLTPEQFNDVKRIFLNKMESLRVEFKEMNKKEKLQNDEVIKSRIEEIKTLRARLRKKLESPFGEEGTHVPIKSGPLFTTGIHYQWNYVPYQVRTNLRKSILSPPFESMEREVEDQVIKELISVINPVHLFKLLKFSSLKKISLICKALCPTSIDKHTPTQIFQNMYFCRRCYRYCCSLHMRRNGSLILNKPYYRDETIKNIYPLKKPCNNCFSQNLSPRKEWTPIERSLLLQLLSIYGNNYCKISLLFPKRSCEEISIQSEISYKEQFTCEPYIIQNDPHLPLTSYTPCSNHDGLCEDNLNCPCNMIGRNCEKFCSCSNECKRKFKGCKCSKGCVSCPCKVKKRECDPDICKCGAKDFDEGKCRNNQLQTNKLKKLCVGESILIGDKSSFALGLFAREPFRKNAFIREYTGELLFDEEADNKWKEGKDGENLSYLFDIPDLNGNDSFENSTIDAFYCGNKSRFANHSETANVSAQERFVLGDMRVGLFAAKNIKEGEELSYDYGEKFGGMIENK